MKNKRQSNSLINTVCKKWCINQWWPIASSWKFLCMIVCLVFSMIMLSKWLASKLISGWARSLVSPIALRKATWTAKLPLECVSSVQFSSVTQSCLSLCNLMACSTPGLPVHHQILELLKLMSIGSIMPFNHLILWWPLFLLPPIPPSIRVFSNESTWKVFIWGGQSIGVSALASLLPMNIQDWSPLGWTGWSPCSPRDSQESSPTHQFKSINSSALRFLHSPNLTSIHDHGKNHSFD